MVQANTATSLCYFLADFFREKTAEIRVGDGEPLSPNVFVGRIPRKKAVIPETQKKTVIIADPALNISAAGDDAPNIQVPELSKETIYPYILIRPEEITDDAQDPGDLGTTVNISITIGGDSKEGDGFLDVCHIIDVLRLELLERGLFGNAELQRPLSAYFPSFEDFETQTKYFGGISCIFQMPSIERRKDSLDFY